MKNKIQRKIKNRFLTLLLAMTCATGMALAGTETIGNRQISLTIDDKGDVVSMKNLVENKELIDTSLPPERLWQVHEPNGRLADFGVNRVAVSKLSGTALQIVWSGDSGFAFTATVEVDKEKPLAYWSMKMKGVARRDLIDVEFPIVARLRNLGDEELAVATWLGSVDKNPRRGISDKNPVKRMRWSSPGSLSMQLMALCGKATGDMLYFSSQDTLANIKEYHLALTANHTCFSVMNLLPYATGKDEVAVPYKAVIGTMKGDWLTAAELYRDWGTKQHWCKESRLKRGLLPKWVTQTALWVWNRGYSDNVLTEALDAQQRLKLPVSVFWHWWHGCSYDEGFPDYLPPREGAQRFTDAVAKAKRKGVNAIVYMNSFQWGNTTESFKRERAADYAARGHNGRDFSAVANIFTGRGITPMCLGTQFWQNKYASIADTVVNNYGVSGVYMDQACSNLPCYVKSHGHVLGGGNSWVSGFGEMTRKIRAGAKGKHVVLGGEGSGEDWIPYLDLFLTLEASRERYLGVGSVETIPLYQAVYHDYAITFGSYSSLTYPPYDDKWPDKYRPANREKPLPEKYNSQFRMEQAKEFAWGMQPTIANYHKFLNDCRGEEVAFLMKLARVRQRALKYLLNGVFVRPPKFPIPEENIDISQISIYAGRSGNTVKEFSKPVPVVCVGAWRSADGCLAVAMANISKSAAVPVKFDINAADYGMRGKCKIFRIDDKSRRKIGVSGADGVAHIDTAIAPSDAWVLEFVPER